MIKWLSGSRLKTGTETVPHSPYTNDPLAAVTEVTTAEGKCHIYAVSRVNPLFREDAEGNSENLLDERSSPRKSISSGYESRCNSSSDSSSCTECEEKRLKKSLPVVKREKRLTKQSKTEKKKRGDNNDKWESGQNGKHGDEGRKNPGNIKRRPTKLKNSPVPVSSNLSPIPEGKIDCSIPPPIWPRLGKICERKRENFPLDADADATERIYHNGSTNPVNFMFKYNERYPKCCNERLRMFRATSEKLALEAEYEHNWVECCRSQKYGKTNHHFVSDDERERTCKTFPPDANLDRLSIDPNDLTQDVLRDLANLIAYAMSQKNLLPWETIFENLAETIRKSLETYSATESDDDGDNDGHFDRNKYLKKVLKAILNGDKYSAPLRTGGGGKNTPVNATESCKLEDLTGVTAAELSSRRVLDDLKEDIYSSGSEGKNSSSSSSGCKDLYLSSNSSCSASKENAFISSSGESINDGNKSYRKCEKNSEDEERKEGEAKRQEDGLLNLIHHQRDFSSSSTESAFGSSDISPPPSDSSSANGVPNPVFLHDNIYSVPKSMRNALICESFNRTKNDESGGSLKNCGSSAFEKFISAKRKTSHDSQLEDLGPLTYSDDEKPRFSTAVVTSPKLVSNVVKKVEHPYYVAIGRPDFTLDLPQAEKLMKKIASSKRRRCWCRFTTSILGLLFFLLSVMMVSLVVTKGRRMFGAL